MEAMSIRKAKTASPARTSADGGTVVKESLGMPMSLKSVRVLESLPHKEQTVTDSLGEKLRARFNADMSGIRIYEDEGLREIYGQRGYAKGNEIHLAKGEFSPNAKSGLELIMHEAGHVVQQGSGMVNVSGIVESPGLEAQADGIMSAPANFSMPAASEASAIQGWGPWKAIKWGSKAILKGAKNIGKGLLDQFGMIDAHKQAVDQYNNYQDDFKKMSWWERFKWAVNNPLAWTFAGLEKGSTERRNREEELLAGGTTPDTSSYSVDNEDAEQFDERAYDSVGSAPGIGSTMGTFGTFASLGALPVGLFGNTGMNMKEDGVELKTGDHVVGGVNSGLNVLSSGLNFANSAIQTAHQYRNGNTADAVRNGIDTLSHFADLTAQGTRLGAYAAGANNMIKAMDTKVIPALDAATGSAAVVKGAVGLASAASTRSAMNDRLNAKGADKNSLMYKAAGMAKNKAKINMAQGGFDMASGALKAAGGGLKLGGVTSLAGTIVGGIGTGVGVAGGFITDEMKHDMRHDLVDQELGLEDKITDFCNQNHCDRKTAKHVILKKLGFMSGKRKEAFNNIVLNRAAKLKKQADSGNDDAIKFMSELGLRAKTGNDDNGNARNVYSLQGIAEKLGMESNSSWEDQLRESRKVKKLDRTNPFMRH